MIVHPRLSGMRIKTQMKYLPETMEEVSWDSAADPGSWRDCQCYIHCPHTPRPETERQCQYNATSTEDKAGHFRDGTGKSNRAGSWQYGGDSCNVERRQFRHPGQVSTLEDEKS